MQHPVLGKSVISGQFDTCSKCGHKIAEDDVPMILFGGGKGRDGLAWCYCQDCEGMVLKLVQRSMKSKIVEAE